MKPLVRCRGLTRDLGGHRILDALDLDVAAGTTVGIIGHNGAGKSTLLAVLAGLLRPTAGEVRVLGGSPASDRAVRAGVGYLGHRPGLYPHLSATEHLTLVGRLSGAPATQTSIAALLEALGLKRVAAEPAGHFSRGMAQRLALARAVLHRPSVLILDEPFTGLDPDAVASVTRLLHAAAEEGAAVIVTAHASETLANLADLVLVLSNGRLSPHGTTLGAAGASRDGEAQPVPVHRPADREQDASGGTSHGGGGRSHLRAGTAGGPPMAPTPEHPLPSAWRTLSALLWKDLAIEWRGRELVPPVLVLALLCVVVLGYTLGGEPAARPQLAGGALWTAFLFGSTLVFSRLLAIEHDAGAWQVLLAGPTDRGLIFVAKWLAGTLVGLALLGLLFPAALLTLGLPGHHAAATLGLLALAASGWSAAGTLAAALTQSAKGRELVLAVVLLPLAMPLVVGVAAALAAFADAATAPSPWPFVLLVAAYNTVYLALGYLTFPWAAES